MCLASILYLFLFLFISEAGKMFWCSFCTPCHLSPTLSDHLKHRVQHRHITAVYLCGYDKCTVKLNSEASLRSHVIRVHNVMVRAVNNLQRATVNNAEAKFICTAHHCKKTLDSYKELIKHLKAHMKSGLQTSCPFDGCDRMYQNIQSFSGHLSKVHRFSGSLTNIVSEVDSEQNMNDNNMDLNCDNVANSNYYENVEENCENISEPSDEETLLDTMSQFYMKLEFQRLLPARTIQSIVSELNMVHSQNDNLLKVKLRKRLTADKVPEDQIDRLLFYVFENNPLSAAHHKLRSNHVRKQLYKNRYVYVKPIKIDIPPKSEGKPSTSMYYVPLKKTVVALFSDKSLNVVPSKPTFSDMEGVYKDFVDGSVFKENQFFKDNPNGLQIILYQDAFEVVVPIGPAKKKYKTLAVYMMIGNLPVHLRSHINSIQLVALCFDKNYNHRAVYGPIVNDLKELETDGVFVPGLGNVKGSLVFIVGDNLGSHGAGGFLESFSKVHFFCRFCLIQNKLFHTDGGECSEHERRTVRSYNNAISRLNTLRRRKNPSFQGVKFNSVFNELTYFHVCLPGLPVCLAHDLYEGVVSYDLKLFISYFVSKEWFSYDTLNKAIAKFPFSTEDKRDKPVEIRADHKRIKGGAWQVFVLLRLLPLIVSDYIKDESDEVWKNLLQLVEIVEIVMAPAIHESYLSYLQSCISEYLTLRKLNFPAVRLRPKHHYLSHYPELIKAYGPLTRVFTLRFESKHTFFKGVVRRCRQFINLLLQLSTKHELLQAYLRTGADSRCDIKVFDDVDFIPHNYAVPLQQAIRALNFTTGVRECAKVAFKGTTYQKGDIVTLRQRGYQYKVEMGRITIILFDNNEEIFFLVEKLNCNFVPLIRMYELGASLSYECISVKDLMSYQPLHVYTKHARLYVKLKSGLVSDKLE